MFVVHFLEVVGKFPLELINGYLIDGFLLLEKLRPNGHDLFDLSLDHFEFFIFPLIVDSDELQAIVEKRLPFLLLLLVLPELGNLFGSL